MVGCFFIREQWFRLRSAVVLLGVVWVVCLQATAQTVRVVRGIPDLENLLSAHSDTVRVVNLWATWCKPCMAELPHFAALAREYAANKVRFIFISLDAAESKNEVCRVVQKLNIPQPVYLYDNPNFNAWVEKIDTGWEGNIPAVVFTKGTHRRFVPAQLKAEVLRHIVDSFLYLLGTNQ